MPEVALSKPDKILFPAAEGHPAITKRELFDYAGRIADRMVPLIADRPAVLQRFPDGIEGEGWYQKHTPAHFPDWIRTVELPKRGGTVRHPVIDSADALRYVVNQGTVTVHVLGGTADRPDRPRELIIDLDPSTDDPAEVVEATRAVRHLLEDLDITGFAKTSGSRGIHVHVPLLGTDDFAAVRSLGAALGQTLADRHPDLLTVEFSKDDRGGRLFVDVLRNAPAQHAVAPYTLRPFPGAPVAVPLRWDEVDRSWDPRSTTLSALFRRLGSLSSDPWAGFDEARTTVAARTGPWAGSGHHGATVRDGSRSARASATSDATAATASAGPAPPPSSAIQAPTRTELVMLPR